VQSPDNFLVLHRGSDRHAFFSKSLGQPPFFEERTNSWVVTDPAQCKELLASPNLNPDDYARKYEALGDRLGLDFSNIGFALEHIPLAHEGDVHMQMRRGMAEFIMTRRAIVNDEIPRLVERYFAALKSDGPVELMSEVIIPFAHDVLTALIGVDCGPPSEHQNVPAVFDKLAGISKRKQIANEIGVLRRTIRAGLGEAASENDIGIRVALVIVGHDSLIGTLGESIYQLLNTHPGRPLNAIAFPDIPPDTGIPFTERTASAPFSFAGCDFARNDVIRIHLQAASYDSDVRTRSLFFGAGAHACLGRPLVIAAWRAVTACFSKIPTHLSIEKYEMRATDYYFLCPQTLSVVVRS
jgi:cytochrome P450